MTDDPGEVRFVVPSGPVAVAAAAVTLAGGVTALAGFALGVGTALVGGTAVASAGLIGLVLLSIAAVE